MNWYFPIESESDLYFEDSYSEPFDSHEEWLNANEEWEFKPCNMEWVPPFLVEDDCVIWFNPNPEPEPEDECTKLSFDELIPF